MIFHLRSIQSIVQYSTDMDDDQPIPKRDSTYPLFSKFFASHPQDVVEHVVSMRKQMEDFIDAFKKRIEVETNYAKSLTQVSKSLDKYIKPGTELASSYICSAFKVEHQQRSRQALELAEALKTQIEIMCSDMLRSQATFFKKMEKDIKRYYKEAETVEDNHRDALTRFEGISKQMEQMIITKNIMKYTTGIPQQKKVKLISKTMESIKEHKQYQKLYLQTVRDFNFFVNSYTGEISNQLNEAEKIVRQQVVLQGDCLRKLIVAEVSMFKNIEYDLLNISKQMEYLDTQKDAQSFVEQYKNSFQNRIVPEEKLQPEVKRYNISLGDNQTMYNVYPKKILGKSMLSNSLLHVDQQYFSWMLFNKKNKKLRDCMGIIWRKLKIQHNEQLTSTPKSETSIPQSKEQTKPEASSVTQNQEPQSIASQPKKEQKQPQAKQQNTKEQGAKQQVQKKQVLEVEAKESKTKQQGIKEQVIPLTKQYYNKQPPLVSQVDWQKQLKELLSSFKIQQPPNFINPIEKKDKTLSVEAVFSSIMEITSTISLLWNVEQFQFQQVVSKLNTLQRYLSEHHLYRLIAFIFIEQYRLQHEVMIKSYSCAKMCSRVIRSIIRQSQKQNDTFIIRGILGLIFTFYYVDDKFKKLIYTTPDIYQCEIWKKHDFWEAAIFETTYEEMAVFTKQKGETGAQTMLREKNLIFSQLASFCHYMVMLGITSKNVRLIVGRYCRLYDMSEEQNKDLSKMITNTSKQFRDTAAAFNLKGAQRQKSVIND